MKRILSLRKNSYTARVGILLIAIALIVGTASCTGVPSYSLTMAVNPAGSGAAGDVTGGSPYAANTVVNIQATPVGSYTFVKWTAPAGTFANANAAATQFTMPAQNVTATANFVGPLDHFKCYRVNDAPSVGINVTLTDQFVSINATVWEASVFANPTQKTYGQNVTNISNPDHHLTAYNISYEGEPGTWYVEVHNQFGTQNLTVYGPVGLAVPTQKVAQGSHGEPVSLDHYLLYAVELGTQLQIPVSLKDEFGNDPSAMVGQAIGFANPVEKKVGTTVTPIKHADEHLVFYEISGCQQVVSQVQIVHQFGNQTLNLGEPAIVLAVPSEKLSFAPVLDHFTSSLVEGGPYIGEKGVYLEDQFCAVNATIEYPTGFANPAEKWHDEVWTPISNPDHHLTGYTISYEGEPGTWQVEVNNQFGTQLLTVYGPVALGVPTQKLLPYPHNPPEGLDHYLAYEVIAGSPVNVVVGLQDEFVYDPQVLVYQPIFFSNPVRKTHEGNVTEIFNPEAHLVTYNLTGGEYFETQVQVFNQFGAQTLDLFSLYALAVPSEMLYWEPIS